MIYAYIKMLQTHFFCSLRDISMFIVPHHIQLSIRLIHINTPDQICIRKNRKMTVLFKLASYISDVKTNTGRTFLSADSAPTDLSYHRCQTPGLSQWRFPRYDQNLILIASRRFSESWDKLHTPKPKLHEKALYSFLNLGEAAWRIRKSRDERKQGFGHIWSSSWPPKPNFIILGLWIENEHFVPYPRIRNEPLHIMRYHMYIFYITELRNESIMTENSRLQTPLCFSLTQPTRHTYITSISKQLTFQYTLTGQKQRVQS